jgi:phage FluMu gp28-like protein
VLVVRRLVEQVTFTPSIKESLATGLYAAFTGGTVRLPSSADALRKDVASIKRIVTSAGNIQYTAPRTQDGHADSAWALSLALHACTGVNPMVAALRAAS